MSHDTNQHSTCFNPTVWFGEYFTDEINFWPQQLLHYDVVKELSIKYICRVTCYIACSDNPTDMVPLENDIDEIYLIFLVFGRSTRFDLTDSFELYFWHTMCCGRRIDLCLWLNWWFYVHLKLERAMRFVQKLNDFIINKTRHFLNFDSCWNLPCFFSHNFYCLFSKLRDNTLI